MMEEFLVTQLNVHGISELKPRLTTLGVRSTNDLHVLHDADLLGAGLNLVQVRRLQAAVKAAEAEKAIHGVSSDEEPDLLPLPRIAEEAPRIRVWSSDTVEEQMTGGTDWSRISEDGKYIEVAPLNRTVTTARRKNSSFWNSQTSGRPLRLVFVRHGESEANVNRTITSTVPDHMLHLTALGRQQALDAGVRLRELVAAESVKFTCSPYVRTRETLNGILQAWGDMDKAPSVREEVRIREQEYGNFDHPDIRTLHKEKRKFGAFYYRFPAGESPADCYDRASLFLESMYRSWSDSTSVNQVIVCHGLMILVLLMRLLRLPIDEFDNFDSLKNCEFVVLERPPEDAKYHISFTWAPGQEKNYKGLRRAPKEETPPPQIWDGSPDAPPLVNTPIKA